jgi:hypothetical protein
MIIDGMDQSHSKLPYLGSQGGFGNHSVSQGIYGVLVHGVGVTLYRTLETVHKGANLVIFCIISEIDKFRMRNGG